MRVTFYAAIAMVLAAMPATAQVIERLADIDTGGGPQVSSFPGAFGSGAATLPGGVALFAATDPEHGRELWLSTGASAVRVADLEPGPGNASPLGFALFDGRAWFSATTTDAGNELWTSDGTPAGTRRVADLAPGAASSQPQVIGTTASPPRLFFAANDDAGRSLYAVDAGSTVPTRIAPGIGAGCNTQPPRAAALGATLVFGAGGTDCEPHVTDGTTAGTVRLADIAPGTAGSAPQRFVAVGAQVYFAATTPALGNELWVTDGTPAGTRNVADLVTGPTNASPTGLVAFGSDLVFVAREVTGVSRLYRTDGTTITPIVPTPAIAVGDETVGFGARICFAANDGTSGLEPWCSDGTGAGTTRLADLTPGSGASNPFGFRVATTASGARLYFITNVLSTGDARIVASDGTTVGTQVLTPLPISSVGAALFATVGAQVLASVSASNSPFDVELWRSDGTVAGTGLLADIGRAPGGSLISRVIASEDGTRGFFAAFSTATGYELWRTDGTPIGTAPVIDLTAGAVGGIANDTLKEFVAPTRAIAFGEGLAFVGSDGTTGEEAWFTDGTAAGTVKLVDTIAGNNDSGPQHFGVLGDRVYFTARTSTSTSAMTRVFRSDGTPGGTTELTVPAGTRFIGPWMRAGTRLYIAGQDTAQGQELWRLDDAGDGMERVVDLSPGSASTNVLGGVGIGDTLVFAGQQAVRGTELVRSDGSAAGTVPLVDLTPTDFISTLQQLGTIDGLLSRRDAIAVGERLFFLCDPDGGLRLEPCITDGSDAGTRRIVDIQSGGSSQPAWPVTDGTRAWFAATQGAARSLFVTDPDATTASLVPGTLGIAPADIARLPGGDLVMSGNLVIGDTPFGRELFAGPPGNLRGFNLAAGELGSSPVAVTAVGAFAVFRANTGAGGNEPYVYRPDPVFTDSYE